MNSVLKINNLNKKYDGFHLKDIKLELPEGYIMGLIGKNGAGKTTTIKCILNMINRDSGEIKIFGRDNIKEEFLNKQDIGVVFDNNYFVDGWSIQDAEKAMKMFYENWDKEKFYNFLNRFKINKNKKIKELSRGMQMKLMLACALCHNAKLLILDEPTSGLDPVSRDTLLEILGEYIEDGQHSVIFSTHITSDLEKVADYITFLKNGEVFFTGEKSELMEMYKIVKGGINELSSELAEKLEGVRKYDTGFEGLIKTKYVEKFTGLLYEPASMDDIIVFTSKGEDEVE